MNINVHIERLVLEGLPVEQRQGAHLQAAVELELTRLLAEGSLGSQLSSGDKLASVKGGSVQLAECANPKGLGRQIAGAVYEGFGAKP
ncbi:hypothetical protein [Sulfurirhabdus autotrophica]|uniref:Uncharacterized protein n=1 Tax=Sulfurirhabdus autotrophica TaxID=1706046 RepID=A0A4R3Y3H9_9PROT|nr:hypothetical protein [Sulfurirhabdus autotrophica]TCV86755.1 hypothetical protein EDC63_106116 [Sulfurirhabdus autotrophica]